MHRAARSLSGLVGVVAWVASAHAGVNEWTTLGPAATVLSVAIDPGPPQTLYTSTPSGVFRLTDGAGDWEPLLDLGGRIYHWAFASPFIYVGGLGTVGVSTDGGEDWGFGRVIPSSRGILSMAIVPSQPLTVYVAAGFGGLFRSTSGGADWAPWGEGFNDPEGLGKLVVVPQNPARMYVTTTSGLYESVDAGAHWTRLPLPTLGSPPYALDPSSPSTLYSCGFDPVAPNIARSDDGGATWSPGAGRCPESLYVGDMVVDRLDPSRLWGHNYVAVFTSRDRGEHWYRLHRGLQERDFGFDSVIAPDTTRPGRLYAATRHSGVAVYDDRCGNGELDAFEACDDGNAVDGDGCRPDCSIERHADGIVDPDEECDDGNSTDGDGCDGNFTRTGCGNGIVTAGEECDDGNDDRTDYCVDCRPACVVDTDCDDGDPCTVDLCTVGGCGWRFPAGVEVPVCAIHQSISSEPCPGVRLPGWFQGRLEAALGEAETQANALSLTPEGRRRQRRTLARHFGALARKTGRLRGRVSKSCLKTIRRGLQDAADAVRTSWPV